MENERDAREQESGFYFLTIATPASSSPCPSTINHQMSSGEKIPDRRNKSSSFETDISMLTSLIASTTTTNGDSTGDPETAEGEEVKELGAEAVEELMRRLEAANGIADGMEEKLDGILEHLDGLLSSLEAPGEKKDSGDPVDPQPDR